MCLRKYMQDTGDAKNKEKLSGTLRALFDAHHSLLFWANIRTPSNILIIFEGSIHLIRATLKMLQDNLCRTAWTIYPALRAMSCMHATDYHELTSVACTTPTRKRLLPPYHNIKCFRYFYTGPALTYGDHGRHLGPMPRRGP